MRTGALTVGSSEPEERRRGCASLDARSAREIGKRLRATFEPLADDLPDEFQVLVSAISEHAHSD
jgi:hypothetical protein